MIGPSGNKRLFVYVIFRQYPPGVRRVNVHFRNIYSSHNVTSGRAAVFTGATVRILLPRHDSGGIRARLSDLNSNNLSLNLRST